MNYAMLNWFNNTFKTEEKYVATASLSVQEAYMICWIIIYCAIMLSWIFGGMFRRIRWTRIHKIKAQFKGKMRIKPKRKDFSTEKRDKCTIFHVKRFQPQE